MLMQQSGNTIVANVISIVQVKGGARRSTLATNLAAALAREGNTTLIDGDVPQGTSLSWGALRNGEGRAGRLSVLAAASHSDLAYKVQQLKETQDYIVIDGPPRIAEITRAMLVMSDLCLIPLGASVAEVWATTDLLKTIEQARLRQHPVDARIVWNRFRGHTRTARELCESVKVELGMPELQSRLGSRVAYCEVLARGLAVDEWHDKAASAELRAMTQEVLDILREKR